LNLHSWYSKNIHKSSDILFCQFAWFLRELDLNTLELLCFGKSRITWLKYRKHCKCFNIIGNCSKTPLFWITNLLKMTEKHAYNNIRWHVIYIPKQKKICTIFISFCYWRHGMHNTRRLRETQQHWRSRSRVSTGESTPLWHQIFSSLRSKGEPILR